MMLFCILFQHFGSSKCYAVIKMYWPEGAQKLSERAYKEIFLHLRYRHGCYRIKEIKTTFTGKYSIVGAHSRPTA